MVPVNIFTYFGFPGGTGEKFNKFSKKHNANLIFSPQIGRPKWGWLVLGLTILVYQGNSLWLPIGQVYFLLRTILVLFLPVLEPSCTN